MANRHLEKKGGEVSGREARSLNRSITLPLVLVHIHRQTQGVNGEGKDNGRALFSGNCVEGLKTKRKE